MNALRSTQNLIILAGYIMGAVALFWFPEQVPPSWARPDGGVVWLGAPMVAFLLPTAVAVTYFLLRGLCIRHPVEAANGADVLAIYDALMLRFSLFVLGVHGMVLLAMLGQLSGRRWAAQIVPLTLGLTMIGIGNLLPRTRPNLAIGIRTRRTLSDRTVWMRMHRWAGYVMVGSGVVIILSALAVPGRVGPTMILAVAPAALVATFLLVLASEWRARPR